METEMLERVAIAIFKQTFRDTLVWETCSVKFRAEYLNRAGAAVEAMREPTAVTEEEIVKAIWPIVCQGNRWVPADEGVAIDTVHAAARAVLALLNSPPHAIAKAEGSGDAG